MAEDDDLVAMRCEIIDELHDELAAMSWRQMVCLAALEYARPFVWKWCHYQGDNPQFFLDTIRPIDAVLHSMRPPQPAADGEKNGSPPSTSEEKS